MNEVKQVSGTLYCNQPTLVGHVLAHIYNLQEAYGYYFKENLPYEVRKIVEHIMAKYANNYGFQYPHTIKHDPIYENYDVNGPGYAKTDEHPNGRTYCSIWPVWKRTWQWPEGTYTNERLAEKDEQIRTWIIDFDYLLHDCMVTAMYEATKMQYDQEMRENFADIAFTFHTFKSDLRYERERDRHNDTRRDNFHNKRMIAALLDARKVKYYQV